MTKTLLSWFAILAATTALSVKGDDSMRKIIDFDNDWRFARFGPMPDGSTNPEPGGNLFRYTVTASSSETDKGNLPELAMDGNKETRWCASGSATV